MTRSHHVVVIPGDSIGPEIVDSGLRIVEAAREHVGGFELRIDQHSAGAQHFREFGRNIDPETLEACRTADAVIKGPVGHPDVRNADGTEAGLLGGVLRLGLDLFANIRPVKLWPGVKAPVTWKPGEIDYVIVRENTEGLYASRGLGVSNNYAASDILFMTRHGVERVSRAAFELARKRRGAPSDGAHRVTCVDKSNVLKSMAFFKAIFLEIAEEYPDIEHETIYSDAAAQALVLNPSHFDVLVMENFLGDLLSDLGGGTVGGIGMCPSGNIGADAAVFEPIHGSAPSLGGLDRANPIAQVLSFAMLLNHLGEADAAAAVERGVGAALADGSLTIAPDGCPVGGTRAATAAIIDRIA
ncbi:MAG: isocitrate/isopropylmalate dehydrogenase family protein [Chloroflexota bacterium]